MNPLVFLLGGLALLVSSVTFAALNKRAAHAENPYDDSAPALDLGEALWSLRHADALYRAGLETGRAVPKGADPDSLAEGLSRTGLGRVHAKRTARRVEFAVERGLMQGAPTVDEPLCYFTLGVLQGALEASIGRPVRVTEERCHGTGAAACLFTAEVAA